LLGSDPGFSFVESEPPSFQQASVARRFTSGMPHRIEID
jgi:hypothetical protein